METYELVAYNLSSELNISRFYEDERSVTKTFKWNEPFILEHGEKSYIFFYNFGTVAFFNVHEEERKKFIQKVKKYEVNPVKEVDVETFSIEIDPKEKPAALFDKAIIPKLDILSLRIISFVVSQSVTLKYFEKEVDYVSDLLYKTVDEFWRTTRIAWSNKGNLKTIAYGIKLRHSAMSELLLLDKPPIAWESSKMDQLYEEMIKTFEINERYKRLDKKLEIVIENSKIITGFSDVKKALISELAIIALFVIDIIIILWEMFA